MGHGPGQPVVAGLDDQSVTSVKTLMQNFARDFLGTAWTGLDSCG